MNLVVSMLLSAKTEIIQINCNMICCPKVWIPATIIESHCRFSNHSLHLVVISMVIFVIRLSLNLYKIGIFRSLIILSMYCILITTVSTI